MITGRSGKLTIILLTVTLIMVAGGISRADDGEIDVIELSKKISGDSGSSMARAGRLIEWVNDNFESTSTDYMKRTVEEIIKNRHGNCAELAKVLRALLEAAEIPCRWVAEINVQAVNKEREDCARNLVAKEGLYATVFGLMHNDHRWLEIYNDSVDTWIPMDPTLGTWGNEQWMETRMQFGPREGKEHNMIVPCVVIIQDGETLVEDRSTEYLINRFNAFYGNKLANLPGWPQWKESVARLSQLGIGAFDGKVNLHEHNDLMEKHLAAYNTLKEQYGKLTEKK